jgi:hypothetical protein
MLIFSHKELWVEHLEAHFHAFMSIFIELVTQEDDSTFMMNHRCVYCVKIMLNYSFNF